MRSLAAFQSSGKKDQHTTFFLLEEEKQFYNSPELQMLQEVLLNIDNMVKTTLEFSTRSFSTSSASATCLVHCFRFTTILPMFYCDGGRLYTCECPNGDGVFIVPECVIHIFCQVNCNRFPGDGIYTFTESDCDADGGTWNSSSGICTPPDPLPQPSAQDVCILNGGYWNYSPCSQA